MEYSIHSMQLKSRCWECSEVCGHTFPNSILESIWSHLILQVTALRKVETLISDTGLAVAKDTAKNAYRKQQPVNQPPAIAKAIVALAADETNNGIALHLSLLRNRKVRYLCRTKVFRN